MSNGFDANSTAGFGSASAGVFSSPAVAVVEGQSQSVEQSLFESSSEFDFFQAVSLLETIYPDRKRVGEISEYGRKPAVKFAANATSMSFAPSAIHQINPAKTENPVATMTVGFMGLTGPAGILPPHYTELIRRIEFESRGPDKYALRAWFDLFNDRLIALFYESWKKYRPYTFFRNDLFDSHIGNQQDKFTTILQSVWGVGMAGLSRPVQKFVPEPANHPTPTKSIAPESNQNAITNQVRHSAMDSYSPKRLALLRYSGLLSQRPRSAVNLRAILQDYFDLPFEVEQFYGNWLSIDEEAQTQLGVENGNCILGQNTMVGDQTWEKQNKILVRVFPQSQKQFLELLPDIQSDGSSNAFRLLTELVRTFVGPELDFDVQLAIDRSQIPECKMDESAFNGLRLGWNTWLSTYDDSLDESSVATDTVFCDLN